MSIELAGETIEQLLVVGFGVTGRAVCEYAAKHGVSTFLSEKRVLAHEERTWLEDRGVPYEDGGHTARMLSQTGAIVLSPSVPPALALLAEARRRGKPVYSEIDLAALVCEARPIIAVTGTNGKSSVVTLVGDLLRFWGRKAPVVGNIGDPFISVVDDLEGVDAVVVEASSYQLEQSVAFHPRVGVLLNLEPDHLVRHGTMDAYAAAKGRVFSLQTDADVAILPRGLGDRFCQGAGRRVFYDDERPSLPDGAERLSPHQRSNVQAALSASEALLPGIDRREVPIGRVVAALRLPHRMENIGFVGGIRVIDDSKATNPASTIAALAAIGGRTVLLLGGRVKAAGYEALAEAIDGSSVRRIVLFGEAANALAERLGGRPIELARDVGEAIRAGLEAAQAGDTLLFSPACSSFDQFRDFEERGEEFTRLIRVQAGFSRS
jgi:UDP-N-acetylmuramoylalanine--D-glutamate ligase